MDVSAARGSGTSGLGGALSVDGGVGDTASGGQIDLISGYGSATSSGNMKLHSRESGASGVSGSRRILDGQWIFGFFWPHQTEPVPARPTAREAMRRGPWQQQFR